jgi:site-specific DNA recombinase
MRKPNSDLNPGSDASDPIKCVIYARVSTEAQVGKDSDFSSVDAQVAGCRRKASEMGWIVVEEFREEGVSAGSLKRPALQRMLALLGTGSIAIVLAVKNDRLSRDLFDALGLHKQFQAWGVK